MSFQVGQRVACIDDDRCVSFRFRGRFAWLRRWRVLDHNLKRGHAYTVTWTGTLVSDTGPPCAVLQVAEARHFEYPGIPFPAFQFAPLIERKTDITIFETMLTPAGKQPVEVG